MRSASSGDSENDLAIIEGVPNSVAVSNAAPKVAAAARWHIGAAIEDAVAGALLDIAAAAKTGAMPALMREGGENPCDAGAPPTCVSSAPMG